MKTKRNPLEATRRRAVRRLSLAVAVGILPSLLIIQSAEARGSRGQRGGGDGGGGVQVTQTTNNAASAIATATRLFASDVKFDTDRFNALSVEANNSASALSDTCTDCKATAIAVQVVLIAGSLENLAATNTSSALNRDCSNCDTTSLAYQFVIAPGARNVRLTGLGVAQMAGIEGRMRILALSGKPGAQLTAEANALIGELQTVLSTQLRVSGSSTQIPIRRRHSIRRAEGGEAGAPSRAQAPANNADDDATFEVTAASDGSTDVVPTVPVVVVTPDSNPTTTPTPPTPPTPPALPRRRFRG